MEPGRFGWALVALVLVVPAALAAAPEEVAPGLLAPEELPQAQLPLPVLPPLLGTSDDDEAPRQGPGEGPRGGEPARPTSETQRRTLVVVQGAMDEAAGLAGEVLETDLVGLVENHVVRPVEGAAQGLQSEVHKILAPPTEEADGRPGPAPAASVSAPWGGLSTPLLVAASAATAGAVVLLWLAGSSTGVGAAGAAGKGAADLRRLLPYASPLFTRFERHTVLGHPKREALYALVMQNPGITLQDLGDATGLSRTAVTHHLRLLEHQHLVVSKRVGRSRHFYENGGRYGRDQKEAYAVLQNERSREMARFIQEHPGAIQKDLCRAFGIQASVAHWHVRRLQEANLVEAVRRGRTVSYFPQQPLPQTMPLAPVTAA